MPPGRIDDRKWVDALALRRFPIGAAVLVLGPLVLGCGDASDDRPARPGDVSPSEPADGPPGTGHDGGRGRDDAAAPPGDAGGGGGTSGGSIDGGRVPPDGGLSKPDEDAGPTSGSDGPPGTPERPEGGAACDPSMACARYCTALENGTSCSVNSSELAECICDCEESTRADCPSELDALLACGGDALALACDGDAIIDEACQDESLALGLCAAEAAGLSCDASEPCRAFCDQAARAGCDNGPTTLSGCYCACDSSVEPACGAELAALVSCAGPDLEAGCDGDGEVTVTNAACASQWAALDGCL